MERLDWRSGSGRKQVDAGYRNKGGGIWDIESKAERQEGQCCQEGFGEVSGEWTALAEESRAVRETKGNLVEGVRNQGAGPNFGTWLKAVGPLQILV